MQQDAIVQLVGKELRTDSRLLSRVLDHRHRTILENIDKYINELNGLGQLPFQTEENRGTQGAPTRYALLNEDQCYFLLTLMRNNERVVRAKLALVKAFREARDGIAKRDLARVNGKEYRLAETNAIKELVEYAKLQGSQNADKYYVAITKMTNDFLQIPAGSRDILSGDALRKVMIVDATVEIALHDGINAGMAYADIYQLAKERVRMLPEHLRISDLVLP